MRVRMLETYWRVEIFEISKMAAIDEFIDCGLSLVNTVQRKVLIDPERNFSSDRSSSDDRSWS